MSRERTTRPGGNRMSTAVVAITLAVVIVPLAYLASVSLMGRDEVTSGVLVPATPAWSNWSDVVTGTELLRGVGNSLFAAAVGAALTLAFALPAAWAIVRYRTGGATLGGTLMSPWLLPPIVAVVPLFTLLRILELNNTLIGLTLVYALVNLPVAIWLLEGFLRRLPSELDEAARMDGAGPVRLLLSIIAPVVSPALVSIGIIVAILNYNEFLLATFLTQSDDAQTLPVVLSMFYGERTPHYGKIAAASLVGIVPVFAAAVLFQRRLVGGLAAGSVK